MPYEQSYWENRVKEDLLDNLAKCQQDLIAAKRELRDKSARVHTLLDLKWTIIESREKAYQELEEVQKKLAKSRRREQEQVERSLGLYEHLQTAHEKLYKAEVKVYELEKNLEYYQEKARALIKENAEMKDKLTAMQGPNHYILRDTWCSNPSDYNTALWYERACEQAERADKAEEDVAAMAEVLRLQKERINDLKAILILKDDLRGGYGN